MSEYQYYEFQAVDRPLTEREMAELRRCSSRATITANRFVNHYDWGDFKGNSAAWMEKYFDAFVYLANWGTHELALRLPRKVLDLGTAKKYCRGEAASVRTKGDFLILELLSLEEDGDGDWDDGSGWLASLLSLRTDLAGGDHRALYLAWLLCVQTRELKDDETEPPVPAGLQELTPSLQAFADFLRIDGDLIAAAAARSPRNHASSSKVEIESWIAALPDAVKTDWLVRLAEGKEPHLRAELLRQVRESQETVVSRKEEAPRKVGELLAAAEELTAKRLQQEAERAARERARKEREKEEARERYLSDLGRREARAWLEVEALIATKQPGKYDEAVRLLHDLRDLGLREGREGDIEARLFGICEKHAKKPSLLERLKRVGLAR